MKSSNIPCVIIRKIRTFGNDSEIRIFSRRNLDIPKDTHYLYMIDSTMVGVRYMHFCQQERAYYSANFDIKYALSRKLAVMHLCLPSLDMRETIISRTIIRAYARRAALAEPIIWVEVGSVYQLGLPGGSLQNTRHRLPYSQHTCIILSQ